MPTIHAATKSSQGKNVDKKPKTGKEESKTQSKIQRNPASKWARKQAATLPDLANPS
ncbi:hypothetical protein BGX27_002059 [Mortierella sp. AM989]|nr:hypothetical protein BGX27_002059 [Mortierella sp. AM989]